MVFFKNLVSTNLSDGFHLNEKTLSKRKWFPLVSKSIFTRRTINCHCQGSLKNGEKNDCQWPEVQLSTSNNELFLSKLFSPYSSKDF